LVLIHNQQTDDTEVRYSLDIARRVIRKEVRRRAPAGVKFGRR
jgi:hypothetical protein